MTRNLFSGVQISFGPNPPAYPTGTGVLSADVK
jgi:hypothetical protein